MVNSKFLLSLIDVSLLLSTSSTWNEFEDERDVLEEEEEQVVEVEGDEDAADEVVEKERIDRAAITDEDEADDERDTDGDLFRSRLSSCFATDAMWVTFLVSSDFEVFGLAEPLTVKDAVVDEADERDEELDEEEVDAVEEEAEERRVIKSLLLLYSLLTGIARDGWLDGGEHGFGLDSTVDMRILVWLGRLVSFRTRMREMVSILFIFF